MGDAPNSRYHWLGNYRTSPGAAQIISHLEQCIDEPERTAAGGAAHGAASPVLRGVARGDAVRRGARGARVRRRGGALLRAADAARDGAHGAPQLPRERHARVALVGLLLAVSQCALFSHAYGPTEHAYGPVSPAIVRRLFLRSVEFAGYVYVFEHWRVYELREGALTCALLFLGIDLLYYWFHRAAHGVPLPLHLPLCECEHKLRHAPMRRG